MQLVRTGAAETITDLLRERGANPRAVMEAVGLRPAQFRDPNTYIVYHKLAALLDHAAGQCQAPLFGLMLTQRQSLSALGDLPMIMARAETVAESLEIVNRYLYLHASGVRVFTEAHGDSTRLCMQIDVGRPVNTDQLMQLSVAHLAMFVAGLLGIDRSRVTLYLQQDGPDTLPAEAGIVFRSVRFNQTFDGVMLTEQQLRSRNHHDETAVTRHLEQHLERLQQQYPNQLENQVMDLIGRLLPTGECCIERVAEALGIHHRTLQERLRAEGLSYREVLKETRKSLATQRLRYSRTNITELALQLGYADIAVFSRQFRHWFGVPPKVWQREQAHAARQAEGNPSAMDY